MVVHKQEHDHGGEQPLKQIQQQYQTNGEYPKVSSYAAKANKYLATDYRTVTIERDTFKVCFSINLLGFLLQPSSLSKLLILSLLSTLLISQP